MSQISHVTKQVDPTGDTRAGVNVSQASAQTPRTANSIQCSNCPETWTGLSACHCSGCHRTFTGITAFDIHRVGGQCNDPAALFTEKGEPRLAPVEKLYWSGWGSPGDKPEEMW